MWHLGDAVPSANIRVRFEGWVGTQTRKRPAEDRRGVCHFTNAMPTLRWSDGRDGRVYAVLGMHLGGRLGPGRLLLRNVRDREHDPAMDRIDLELAHVEDHRLVDEIHGARVCEAFQWERAT